MSSSLNGLVMPACCVGLLRGVDRRLPAQEVEGRIVLRVGLERDGDGLHQHVVVAEALGQLALGEDGDRGAVGLRAAVVEAERPRDDRRVERLLDGDLLLQHRLRRQRAVVMVLHGDLGEVLAAGAVGLEVARGAEREPAGRRHRQAAHAGGLHARTGDAAVLRLVEADHEHGVVEAAGDGEDAEAERVGAGGAVVLHHADRAAEELQRVGHLGGAVRRDRRRRRRPLRSASAGSRCRRPRRPRTPPRRSCPRAPCPSSRRTCSSPCRRWRLCLGWRLDSCLSLSSMR